MKPARDEFLAMAERSTAEFSRSFCSMLRAVARKDSGALLRARERCAQMIGETMTLADLYGRRRLLLEYDAARPRGETAAEASAPGFAAAPTLQMFAITPIVAAVTFSEAYHDLLSREPRLAETASAVSELYRTKHAFALAKSAEMQITEAVQRFVARAIKEGKPAPTAARMIAELGDFARGYAGTVYRTNLTTAYTAGRFQQAQEPGVRVVLPAMERWSIRDSAVRQGRAEDGGENHLAAAGLIAATTDPIWKTHSPPSSYGCRCGVRMVPLSELRRRGLLKADGTVIRYEPPGFGKFAAHPNFGSRRTDLVIYG